ncbi:hypothetical protein [[Limnothrix rosea] IAM M-220]|uniref:hypothetical protein n=1 Tax=[Limnothrix rosea] IAM M-220 TaxID=454133 RepID=UPI000964FFFE|nr:hypothetical protein [[Limnothrix rosea] IAM M-220]OKH18114.1 glucosyl-3-phosphoglycerate synthase [[Limnothrix rosea] IAM M-220]
MDFNQDFITTIHDFNADISYLEKRLRTLSATSPMALLIPSLYEELQRPALTTIKKHLKSCDYIKFVNVCLYAETQEQYHHAVEFFSELPQHVNVIWTNGPRITELISKLAEKKLNLLDYAGKGWAVWLGLGLSSLQADIIALHDADIVTFDRSLVAKLFYPVAEPEFGIAYNKAYYTRLGLETRAMHGRAVRLFVAPLLATLEDVLGRNAYLHYLRSFRYPLAGEFALTSVLAVNLRIPCDWGLEVGLLAEVYRNAAPKRIAQVDLGFFDHKHKAVGDNPTEGLQKMCTEILSSILRTLTESESVVFSKGHQTALQVKFRRVAQDLIRQYFVDATCNGIPYDRHREEMTVESFEKVIPIAFKKYLNEPVASRIPDWTRALAVMPNLRELLHLAVEQDMAEAKATNAR